MCVCVCVCVLLYSVVRREKRKEEVWKIVLPIARGKDAGENITLELKKVSKFSKIQCQHYNYYHPIHQQSIVTHTRRTIESQGELLHKKTITVITGPQF